MSGARAGDAGAVWRLVTPAMATGSAIAVMEVCGDIEWACTRLGLATVKPGAFGLRDFAGIDRGIAARWSAEVLHLMPHGGAAVLRAMAEWLGTAGVTPAERFLRRQEIHKRMPQARSEVEALALWALGAAASPAAAELLLRQHELWHGHDLDGKRSAAERERDETLMRVMQPPLVLIWGAANVGKSRLLNALAGRQASIVSDEPGTTRDHVGVHVLCGDVVMRVVDTPGLRLTEDGIEKEAVEIARQLWSTADLVLWCGDEEHGYCDVPQIGVRERLRVLKVGMKSDLGRGVDVTNANDGRGVDHFVSGETGVGVAELAAAMTEMLVPEEMQRGGERWRFWGGLAAE
jgi:tRNA modification GTPase